MTTASARRPTLSPISAPADDGDPLKVEPVLPDVLPVAPVVPAAPAAVATPLDVESIVAAATSRAADRVLGELRPFLDGLAVKLASAPAPERQEREPDRRAPAEMDAGTISDDDVPFLAASLTDAQLDKILVRRRGAADMERWAKLGAVPGEHVITTDTVKLSVNGKPVTVQPDTVLKITDLDPKEHEELRNADLLRGPAEMPVRAR